MSDAVEPVSPSRVGPIATSPNHALQADRALAMLALRPLSANVDMTSAVKYQGDAGIGRAVAALGLVPDFVDAAVMDTTRDERCTGYRDSASPGDRRF